MKKIVQLRMLLVCLITLISCSSNDDDNNDDTIVGCFSCLYEQQKSTKCNTTNYGPWEERSITIDEPRDGLNPEQFCNEQYPSSDIECQAGCCIRFRFRNVRVGPCQ